LRILLLVDDYYPSTKAAARVVNDLGKEFVRCGHQAIVVTPGGEAGGPIQISREDGMQVVRVRMGTLKNVNRLIRGWRETRLSALLWRRAKAYFQDTPCDLIVYYSPSIFFGSLVKKLKLLWGCPAYLVLRDIFPKWALDAGVLKKGIVYEYFRRKERLQYSVADVIGVEAEGNLGYFRDELRSESYRLEVLPNWMDLQVRPARTETYRERLGLLGKVVFFYGGTIGVAQGADAVLRLAATLAEDARIFFLLAGTGTEVPRLQDEIGKQRLPNITILPPVPQEEYLQFASDFDVGVVTLERRLTTHCCPGKALGYMACGLPILASLNPGNDLAALLRNADAGIACDSGDDESFRKAAMLLAANPVLRERLGRNSRKLLETRFSVQTAVKQILSHFPEAVPSASVHSERSQIALGANAVGSS
jgi:glycosyltransferase involved in cell wall biosynthesis